MSRQLLRAFGLRPRSRTDIPALNATPLTNGLFNLPLELWLDIFAYAAAFSIRSQSIAMEIQSTESTYYALCHDHSVFSHIPESHNPSLFKIRRSIILVCRAWYQLGISTLYSHVLINTHGPVEKLNSLYTAVKRHSYLATSVIRLSMTKREEYRFLEPIPKSNRLILSKLFLLLTNVRIFTFPLPLIRYLRPNTRPKILMVLQEATKTREYSFLDRRASLRLASEVQTLFVQSRGYHRNGFFNNSGTFRSSPSLSNLVNLRLDLENDTESERLVNDWNLPRLRTLSIACSSLNAWLDLIRRHAENLEALEITFLPICKYGHGTVNMLTDADTIRFPNLTKLCIPVSECLYYRKPNTRHLNLFVAPRLTQLCFGIVCMSDWFRGSLISSQNKRVKDRRHLKRVGDKAQEVWPRMRELSFSYWAKWKYVWKEEVPRSEEDIKKDEDELDEEDKWKVDRFETVSHKETEADRLDALRWLVEGWLEADITVVLKHQYVVEMVFPRKSEGGMAAMREYPSLEWPSRNGW